ncbi:Coronin-2B [Physocladia obscura]|uniref:Coronin n=1 Tax=Physocladia obscura TaxID=109957 RepID=A0AAD5T269_9FUNG|nr:Coronin-2B [Physocladia obscura]
MSRFVRASKYRHVFGTPNKKENCYDNLKVSRSAWDSNLVKANSLFISVNIEVGGGGAFAVIPLANTGKLDVPLFLGHSSAVLDTDFNPFNDHIVASASEDSRVMVWQIPEGGPTANVEAPVLTLNGHGRKVGHILFHPTADNVLLSASADYTVKIWDISTGQQRSELANVHADLIQGLTFNYNGTLVATTCKDKKLRIFDVRTGAVVNEINGHQGIKGSRVEWLGSNDKFVTTGFSRSSERQLFVWDHANLESGEPLKSETVDNASGLLIPKYDNDTNMLYVAGKGDGNIRYYEWVDDDKSLYLLSEYKSQDSLRGIGFLPKRACAINECEVARIFKVHPTMVEPISMKVPRKADTFQADIFPDTAGPQAALTSDEFFAGKTANPILISLEKGFAPSVSAAAFVTTGTVDISSPGRPSGSGSGSRTPVISEKELQDTVNSLRRENDELKVQVNSKDARIRQLEAQLEQLKASS